jgi:hypothetical protein
MGTAIAPHSAHPKNTATHSAARPPQQDALALADSALQFAGETERCLRDLTVLQRLA